jgi:hypothetical protein
VAAAVGTLRVLAVPEHPAKVTMAEPVPRALGQQRPVVVVVAQAQSETTAVHLLAAMAATASSGQPAAAPTTAVAAAAVAEQLREPADSAAAEMARFLAPRHRVLQTPAAVVGETLIQWEPAAAAAPAL